MLINGYYNINPWMGFYGFPLYRPFFCPYNNINSVYSFFSANRQMLDYSYMLINNMYKKADYNVFEEKPKIVYKPVQVYKPIQVHKHNTSNYSNDFLSVTSYQNLSNSLHKPVKVKKHPHTKLTSTRNTNLPVLAEARYDNIKGSKLASIARRNAHKSVSLCARYTKKAIEQAGLGSYQSGNAYQCADILRRNPNFKEIKVSGNKLSSLPAGCVIVYDRGAAGYSKKYGHVEITLGNGCAASDFINTNIRPSENVHVFVPV